MCRLVAYLGKESILIGELLEKPNHSLIKQSNAGKEGKRGIHADGFGVAWYDFSIDKEPGIFRSIQPAWNDDNLKHLCKKISSHCFLGHIRASTVGDVNKNNCHPFSWGDYAFVHNGTIRHFESVKRQLLDQLEDELFFQIKGNTDSECFFFLIMHYLKHYQGDLERATREAIFWVAKQQKSLPREDFSRINIVITNGEQILATRFVTKGRGPLSLNYFFNEEEKSLVISSEVLNPGEAKWKEVPNGHYLYFDKRSMVLKIEKIK